MNTTMTRSLTAKFVAGVVGPLTLALTLGLFAGVSSVDASPALQASGFTAAGHPRRIPGLAPAFQHVCPTHPGSSPSTVRLIRNWTANG